MSMPAMHGAPKPIGEVRSGAISSRIRKPLNVEVEQRGEKSSKPSGETEIPYSGRSHGRESTQEAKPMMGEVIWVRRRSCFGPHSGGSMRNIDSGDGFRTRVARIFPSAVKRD